MDVYCKCSLVEDGDEYLSVGCWYQVIEIDGGNIYLTNNFGGISCVYKEDVEDYLDFTKSNFIKNFDIGGSP